MIQLDYRRFLEADLPPGVPPGTVPMWSWPLPLSDGSTILSLLYRPLAAPGGMRFEPATQIFHIGTGGESSLWTPAAGYPAPVIFYANQLDHLVGFDLSKPGKLYACTPGGAHLWTLETSIRLDNLIAPESFHQHGGQLHWRTADNVAMTADLAAHPTNIRPAADPPAKPAEVHHPHAHVIGSHLYVLDFDPLARVTRYRIMDSDR